MRNDILSRFIPRPWMFDIVKNSKLQVFGLPFSVTRPTGWMNLIGSTISSDSSISFLTAIMSGKAKLILLILWIQFLVLIKRLRDSFLWMIPGHIARQRATWALMRFSLLVGSLSLEIFGFFSRFCDLIVTLKPGRIFICHCSSDFWRPLWTHCNKECTGYLAIFCYEQGEGCYSL